MAFRKRVEDFVCEHCGHTNVGTGFTDHCQKCLWSKHVDIDPGDRREACGGMMEPVEMGSKHNEPRILNKCAKCGFMRWAKINLDDNIEVGLEIQRKKGAQLR